MKSHCQLFSGDKERHKPGGGEWGGGGFDNFDNFELIS